MDSPPEEVAERDAGESDSTTAHRDFTAPRNIASPHRTVEIDECDTDLSADNMPAASTAVAMDSRDMRKAHVEDTANTNNLDDNASEKNIR
jgi:hypothetical protein